MNKSTVYKIAQKAKVILPLKVRYYLRKLGIANFLYNTICVDIEYNYNDKKINFKFIAPPKLSIKAKEKGVENTICREIYEFSSKTENETVLDIGMNFGFLSLAWAKALPDLQIIAFEVHPEIIKSVKKAASLSNIENLRIVNQPISNLSGQNLDFHLDLYTGSNTTNSDKKTTLKSITIDDYIKTQNKKVCAIKIDTDGFDYDCLIGAKETIISHKPLVVIETNNDKRILDFFKDIHYFVYDQNQQLLEFADSHNLNESRFANLFAYPEKLLN
jgi:FkbM family methyltransferase